MPPKDTPHDTQSTTKVARLLEEYDLGEEFGAKLERLWTAEGDERESLRSLADRFNRRLLESAMANANMSSLDGEADNLYRLLTSDEVSGGAQLEARNRLTQNGVDVDRLETDFVTYQAIRTYLKNHRGAEYEQKNEQQRIESIVTAIQRLISRLESVTGTNLAKLRDSRRLTLGEFRVFVRVDVLCEECGSQYGAVELLQRGGCDCERN